MKDESKVLVFCLVVTMLSLVCVTYKYVALITMSPQHNDAVAGDNTEEHSEILPDYPEIGMSPEQVDKVWAFERLEEACHVGTNGNDAKLVTYREGQIVFLNDMAYTVRRGHNWKSIGNFEGEYTLPEPWKPKEIPDPAKKLDVERLLEYNGSSEEADGNQNLAR